MKWTIRKKLMGTFAALLVLLVAIGGVAVYKMGSMSSKAEEISTNWLPAMGNLSDLNASISNVDRMTMMIVLETNPDEQEKIGVKMETYLADIKKYRANYEPTIVSDQEKQLYDLFSKEWDTYVQQLPDIIRTAKAKDYTSANKLLAEAHISYNKADDRMDSLQTLNLEGGKQAANDSIALDLSARSFVITMSIVATLIGLGLAYGIGTALTNPILKLAAQVRRVRQGDLTLEPLVLKARDELGVLATDFNEMTANLHQVMSQVALNAQQVAATAEELTAGADETSQAADQIAGSVHEVTMGTDKQLATTRDSYLAVADISSSMTGIANSVENVTDSSLQATETAKSGQQIIQKTISQMRVVQRKVNDSAKVMDIVGNKSQEIGEIISLITTITSQTNLLALNAAIEAARAGEHGRGFSVVAEEVRKLAEQSAHATEQIRHLITEMQDDTSRAVDAMQDGTAAVDEGMTMMNVAGESFEAILGAVETLSSHVEEVSTSVEQVHAGTQVMVVSMEEVARLSEQAAANAQSMAAGVEETNASMEEIAAAANLLSRMAEELQGSISVFRI